MLALLVPGVGMGAGQALVEYPPPDVRVLRPLKDSRTVTQVPRGTLIVAKSDRDSKPRG